jgi:Putative peptidoglycan binding domain
VPVDARECELRVPAEDLVFAVALGGLDPGVERSGNLQRLMNLGYLPPPAWEDDEEVARSIRLFQSNHGLEVTGALDDATREALKNEHEV